MSEVQSVVFSRPKWRSAEARAWLKKHGFLSDGKLDMKPTQLRYRQRPPSRYKRFVSKRGGPGILLVVGFR
jgi:hypothetical protein